MSYLLSQILICLLIAGLIGAIIGWLLRGGCSSKIRDCEDEWKMKMGSLESEYNSKLQREDATYASKEMQAATLKRHEEHIEAESPSYSYQDELKEKLNIAQNIENLEKNVETTLSTTTKATIAGVSAIGASALATRGISLSEDKVNLYAKHGVDFEKGEHLEDDYDIQALEGINHDYTQKLKTMGITSTKDFVKLAQENNSAEKIAKSLNIEPSKVTSWIGKSCLLELPGVDTKTAELMQNAGIASPEHLASNTPEVLHRKLEAFNNEALIPVTIPDIKSISLWSNIAKPLTAAAGTATLATAYSDELKAKIQPSNLNLDSIKQGLMARGVSLNDTQITLYADNGIDFEKASNLEDNYHVESIEGIGPKYAKSLREMGIRTTEDLVKKLYKNHDGIDQVAKALKVQPEALSSWISMADLIKLPGVDAQTAELMQTVGISTAAELAITNPNSLHIEMVEFNKKSPIAPEVPSIASLALWSKIAKMLG